MLPCLSMGRFQVSKNVGTGFVKLVLKNKMCLGCQALMVAGLQGAKKVSGTMVQELKPGKISYKQRSGICLCLCISTHRPCLVGVRTVHHDVWFWRGCRILRHVRIDQFFLAKENIIIKEANSKGRSEKKASNQSAPQRRKKVAGYTSTSWCQCSMGFRGFANMATQCSLPGPSASLPTRHIPITSLWPILMEEKEKRKRPH